MSIRVTQRRHAGFRFAAVALASLLVAGLPGVPLRAAAPLASVEVQTSPEGATVYLDGVARGTTPLSLSAVDGEHQMRLVKDGYLENARTLRWSGAPQSLRVRLTPTTNSRPLATAEAVAAPAEPPAGKRSSALKWVLIGTGAAVVGGTAYYLLTKNAAPVAGTITVSPTGTGMAGGTSYSFTSNASDPDNDSLTFQWDFGDGGTGSGQTTSHVFGSAGDFTVTLKVSDPSGDSATTSTSVSVGPSMTATWNGRIAGVGNPAVLRTTQSGGSITGTLTFTPPADNSQPLYCTGTCSGSITGTVGTTYPAAISFQGNISGLALSFSGQSVSGSSLSGTSSWSYEGGSVSGVVTFTRQ